MTSKLFTRNLSNILVFSFSRSAMRFHCRWHQLFRISFLLSACYSCSLAQSSERALKNCQCKLLTSKEWSSQHAILFTLSHPKRRCNKLRSLCCTSPTAVAVFARNSLYIPNWPSCLRISNAALSAGKYLLFSLVFKSIIAFGKKIAQG